MKVGYAKKVIEKKKYKAYSRRGKRVDDHAPPRALQDLFLCCRHVFSAAAPVPLPQHVIHLRAILDKMKTEDVGLSRNVQFFNPDNNVTNSPPRVTYTTIYKSSTFSLCLFFIPAKGVIPLHNHPDMTVFSKLLVGEMHVKAYDWAESEQTETESESEDIRRRSRLAKLKTDGVITAPCETMVLYPETGGNIHSFTAVTACVVLDVIGPPYSKQQGRDCSYYTDHPSSDAKDDHKYAWLEEIELPRELHMDGIQYMGPQIIDI